MGPAVKTPADIIVIRETVKGNSDSKEMQRTATAGFYAGFVGQGIEYTQIISNADYQLSMIITSAKGVNSINNPLSYLLFIKDFSLTQTIDAAKAGLQDVWNGTYDSAIGRKIGAGTFNYLLMTIGGAQLKGKGTACKAVESGLNSNLLDELANSGVKYNPEDIVAITKTADGKLVWLENGTDTAGLNHIITEHADDFLNKGITQEQIPDYVMNALENGKIVGYQGRGTGRPIYEFTYNGEIHKVAITVGNNGFIVGANPK